MTGNRHILKRVAIAAVLVMAAASCSREPFDYKGIHFKAQSVGYFGNPRTKTAYAGQGDGNTERIDWTDGDIVTIYSDKAYVLDNPGVHSTDYKVSSHTGDGSTYVSTATISPAELANALQWGSGTNTFYAMYPSPSTPGLSDDVAFNAGEMTFPILAEPNLIKQGENLIYTPDMKYAPMLAKATATSGTSSVKLAFAPEYTAFEFTVSKGSFSELHISSFTLMSTDASEPVSGVITIPAGEYADEDEVTVTGGGTTISVNWATPVLLDEDHPELTITVFTVPKTLSHLKIIYTGTEISTRSLELKNAGGVSLQFPARKKYRIYGLSFPVIVPVDNPEAIAWAYTAQVLDNFAWWFNSDIEPEGWEDWVDPNTDNSGDYGAGIMDGLCWWINSGIEPLGWVIWTDTTDNSGDFGATIDDKNSWWDGAGTLDDITWTDFPLSEITLSQTEPVYLWTGQSVQRSAVYSYPWTTINWTFQSQPQSGVVEVKNTNGIVTAVGPGVATIYATVTSYDGKYSCSANYTVYVNTITGVTLSSADASVAPGGITTMTATITHTANGPAITSFPTNLLVWSSASTGVITLSGGSVLPATADALAHTVTATATATGVAVGTSTITASSNPVYKNGISASLTDYPCEN